ncbi:MAG: hypothetical protein DSZ28_01715 [Thiothrix sp.]|nr:MAG: hypothetical protein DSZ28_01715 [Thiothrix sp.]
MGNIIPPWMVVLGVMLGPSLLIIIGYRRRPFRWRLSLLVATVVAGLWAAALIFPRWNNDVKTHLPDLLDGLVLWLIGCVFLAPIPLLVGWWGSGFRWHWKTLSIKQRIWLVAISLIIFWFLILPPASYEGLITLVVALGIMTFMISPKKDKGDYAKKDEIDYLAGRHHLEEIQETMGNSKQGEATSGIWCGRALTVVQDTDDEPLRGDIHVSMDDRAVVIGPPGTGKTAFLIEQLLRWGESGRSFVCLDIKPEIYGITQTFLEKQGYALFTYNPTTRTGQKYNMLADLDSPESVGELASALIPSEDPRDTVFTESARDFLDAIISHLAAGGTPSLPLVRALVADCHDHHELMDLLLSSPDPDAREIASGLMLIAKNDRLLGSIFATFRANLRFLRYPAIRESLESSDFSLSELTTGKSVGLFLQFEEAQRETTARLLSVMIVHIMRYLITHTDRPPVLCLWDEIGNAPAIPGLVEKLNTIRSRKMPTWLYWQSLEQMQRYGEKADEGANKILGACDFQATFRLNDNASAEWMSRRIGVVDRVVEKKSVSKDPTTWTNLTNLESYSTDLVQEPIIFPHELGRLKQNEFVCMYRGKAWKGEATPYFQLRPEYQNRQPAVNELRGGLY